MVSIIKERVSSIQVKGEKTFEDLNGYVICKSSDVKPIDNFPNGFPLLEMDTGALYFFDGSNKTWLPFEVR